MYKKSSTVLPFPIHKLLHLGHNKKKKSCLGALVTIAMGLTAINNTAKAAVFGDFVLPFDF